MEQQTMSVTFQDCEDIEVTAINGILKIFEVIDLDEKQRKCVIAYLNKRMEKE